MHDQIILIVDDEATNLALLAQLLQPHYQVRAANSGAYALRAAAVEPHPDLILLDVMMPGLDGYGVLDKLREMPPTREIPVIFVTALSDAVNEEHGLALGAVDYIGKPIKPAIVLARVRAQLELKQARDRLNAQNADLEAEVARRVGETLLMQEISLAAMAGLVETRDTDTGNHILRTRSYVEVLARQLQADARFAGELREEQLLRIVKASPLHDIGKVGIPDRILLKPGKLEPEEFEIIKGHSRIGGEAIRHAIDSACRHMGTEPGANRSEPLALLEVAEQIALYHHERWDGDGYPDRLAGIDIPLPARIMAVADVFDALTTRRIYKPAMSFPEAGDYMAGQAGRQFDPEIVGAFLKNSGEFVAIASRFQDAAGAGGVYPPSPDARRPKEGTG